MPLCGGGVVDGGRADAADGTDDAAEQRAESERESCARHVGCGSRCSAARYAHASADSGGGPGRCCARPSASRSSCGAGFREKRRFPVRPLIPMSLSVSEHRLSAAMAESAVWASSSASLRVLMRPICEPKERRWSLSVGVGTSSWAFEADATCGGPWRRRRRGRGRGGCVSRCPEACRTSSASERAAPCRSNRTAPFPAPSSGRRRPLEGCPSRRGTEPWPLAKRRRLPVPQHAFWACPFG